MNAWSLLPALFALLILAAPSSAARCVEAPDEFATLSSEGHCLEGQGIPVVDAMVESASLACVVDPQVRSTCGADGQLARVHAFKNWLNNARNFENHCAATGGTFAYSNPNFREPSQESFCNAPHPETSSSMFEETYCNYKSACPAAEVVCRHTCAG